MKYTYTYRIAYMSNTKPTTTSNCVINYANESKETYVRTSICMAWSLFVLVITVLFAYETPLHSMRCSVVLKGRYGVTVERERERKSKIVEIGAAVDESE